jgi:Glycosyl transferase family 11
MGAAAIVVTKVYGGLGNQMFQYAAGLGVAERLDAKVLVDTSWFRQVPKTVRRTCQLPAFGIPTRVSLGNRGRLLLRPPTVVRERAFAYDPRLEQVCGNVLLDGYWQSYRYFEHCEQRVRTAFSFPPPTTRSEALLSDIHDRTSVAVHVRRGDYLAPKRAARFGVLPLEYYRAAIELILRQVADAQFLVFSDDAAWCKEAFAENPSVAVPDRARDVPPYEDMFLMASCKHVVVANSSFSWWAAWLNPNPNKVVVAPRRWFRDPSLDTSALVPPGWLRL